MTNPSETRDSELVRRLRNEATCFETDGGADPEVDAGTARLLREAADTIDRLTSTGEAVVTAEIMGTIIPYLAPAVSISEVREKLAAVLASPREGHVEDAEALRVAREVISDMVRYGHITTETGTTAYYVGENVLPTIMGRPLPHNQGETKP